MIVLSSVMMRAQFHLPETKPARKADEILIKNKFKKTSIALF